MSARRETLRPRPWEAVNCTEAEWDSFTEWERAQFEATSAASFAEFGYRVRLLGAAITDAVRRIWGAAWR